MASGNSTEEEMPEDFRCEYGEEKEPRNMDVVTHGCLSSPDIEELSATMLSDREP